MPSIRFCTVSSRPRGVKDTSLAHELLSNSLAFDVAAFSASSALSWSSFNWIVFSMRSIGRSLTPGARPPHVCARSLLSGIEPVTSRPELRATLARGDGVWARPQDGIPHKDISVGPEGIVEAVRPEHEGEEVAVEKGPEDRSIP